MLIKFFMDRRRLEMIPVTCVVAHFAATIIFFLAFLGIDFLPLDQIYPGIASTYRWITGVSLAILIMPLGWLAPAGIPLGAPVAITFALTCLIFNSTLAGRFFGSIIQASFEKRRRRIEASQVAAEWIDQAQQVE